MTPTIENICAECGIAINPKYTEHLRVNGRCINALGREECHCFDFITSGTHWAECPKAKQ